MDLCILIVKNDRLILVSYLDFTSSYSGEKRPKHEQFLCELAKQMDIFNWRRTSTEANWRENDIEFSLRISSNLSTPISYFDILQYMQWLETYESIVIWNHYHIPAYAMNARRCHYQAHKACE